MVKRSKFCLVGIPDDQAVIGRLGAKYGPRAFRKAFSKLRGAEPVQDFLTDLGDTSGLGPSIESNHQLAATQIRDAHEIFSGSIVVGGGHDHGYSHLLGVYNSLKNKNKRLRLGCLNIDAHFDLRSSQPKITSGSPFYLALESGILEPKRLIEFGIQTHCNAPALWDYAKAKKIKTIQYETLRFGRAISKFRQEFQLLAKNSDVIVLSVDLDAAASRDAPGVSAPQAEGFSASEMITMAEIAGAERKCISLGIFELNPEHDRDDQTSRLAATLAYHFLEKRLKLLKK